MTINRLQFGLPPDEPRKTRNTEHVQPRQDSTLSFNIAGIVSIKQNEYKGQLYAKSEQAMQLLFDELRKNGYIVYDPTSTSEGNIWLAKNRNLLKELSRQKPENLTIHEAWRWAPLEATPQLYKRILRAAGIVPDCSYYYQDGRPEFWCSEKEDMRTFVEHFTTLNIDTWDNMIQNAPIDGPGMIKAVAQFCHPLSRVEDGANIGNWLVTAGKVLDGQPVTEEDEIAAIAAELDPGSGKEIRQLIEGLKNRKQE